MSFDEGTEGPDEAEHHAHEECGYMIDQLRTQLAESEAEVEGLRENRKRLNWIEEGPDPDDIDFGESDGKWLIRSSDGTGFESDCFRDAVDCAMRQDLKAKDAGEESAPPAVRD